jgi:hypothetical protein
MANLSNFNKIYLSIGILVASVIAFADTPTIVIEGKGALVKNVYIPSQLLNGNSLSSDEKNTMVDFFQETQLSRDYKWFTYEGILFASVKMDACQDIEPGTRLTITPASTVQNVSFGSYHSEYLKFQLPNGEFCEAILAPTPR